MEVQTSFYPRPRLYCWQVIAETVPREATIHALQEIAPRRQHGDGLVREAYKEPPILRPLVAREEERFGRTR